MVAALLHVAGLQGGCQERVAPGPAAAGQGAVAQPVQPAVLQVKESVTVVADRGLAGVSDSASSVVTLVGAALTAPPALALDDVLHQVAGFQLFRRTSSWTANPTSQGVSLRGLGSTAASRTLVVSDEIPFNDPFGGWVHWSEIPVPATSAVVLLRGGAADLYGSSAIGGVIDVVPVRAPLFGKPSAVVVTGNAEGASEDTALADLVVSASRGPVRAAGGGQHAGDGGLYSYGSGAARHGGCTEQCEQPGGAAGAADGYGRWEPDGVCAGQCAG